MLKHYLNIYKLYAFFSFMTTTFLISGCSTNVIDMAPSSPTQQWEPISNKDITLSSMSPPNTEQNAAVRGAPHFAMSTTPTNNYLIQNELIDVERRYDLPQLIDLAQSINPATRSAWHRARQAAIAVGMTEATYLPLITASVVGGSQTLKVPLGAIDVESTERGTAQILSLQWLLFDFGQREAIVEEAKHGSIAANSLFNGAHQQLIFNISQAYYLYAATVQRQKFTEAAYHNAEAIDSAVEARASQGLATSIETAQARQALAQANFRRAQAAGDVRITYQNLLGTVGINSPLKVNIDGVGQRPLPTTINTPINELIQQALATRPDIAASYSALLASKAGVEVAQAGYLPKVYLGGNLNWGSGNFDISGLPSIGQQGSGSGVLLGVTIPIYDGGLRKARIRDAQSRAEAAQDDFQRLQTTAVTEIVTAHNTLHTALESHRAALELVNAASTTYQATLAAYRNGIGTIDAVTAADTALLDARQILTDAHTTALINSVNLAFAIGSLTSRESLP
ncbi:TolC family protein [Vibrio alginolyticus]|uniref:TolC family protein n=1 Tax=Vibrio alginolyticus TaxID=663 RepID=UPI0023B12FDC|nr:TolC family protein [Vibrio alginolyticus]WED60869.1 TolC family protein [Vibrio alginolyticus]